MEDNFEVARKDLVDFDIWFKEKDYSRSSYYLQQAEEKTAKGVLAKFGLLGEKNTHVAHLLNSFGIPVFSAEIDYNHPWSRNLLKQLRSIYSGNATTLLRNFIAELNPLELIDNALAIGYDTDADDQKAEEFAEGVKKLLDLLPDTKNKISQRLGEIRASLDQLAKTNKEKALPIMAAIAEKSNLPKKELIDAIKVIDNDSVSDTLGKERLDNIVGESSIYYSLIEGTICLIALAIFDIILKRREISRYPDETPRFKEAQMHIKEQLERCIDIGKGLQSINSFASRFYSLN
ncbi:HEPN domain-containing protein [Candidatus Parvarchaeota archaeon]|jgi:HEPN domain.|nr:HEPN domain-containing protein [Candidatus Parvarchaeota archaeon]